MHTREKLTGSVCKCMQCAADRQKALAQEALLRYPQTYQSNQYEIASAEQAISVAEYSLKTARARQRGLIEDVRKELVNEAFDGR